MYFIKKMFSFDYNMGQVMKVGLFCNLFFLQSNESKTR